MDKYLTIEQAAEQLGMSARYVRRLIAERRIPFHRMGRSVRIATIDLVAFAASTRVEPLSRDMIRRQFRRAA